MRAIKYSEPAPSETKKLRAVALYQAADEYALEAQEVDKACKHGHFGCARVEGGACSDELLDAAMAALDDVGLTPQDL